MYIDKIEITNYKCYKDTFTFTFNQGLTILVGDNSSGKSTILEAINLALTGYLHGKPLSMILSQYIFNKETVDDYLLNINLRNHVPPPKITISLFLAGDKKETALFWGDGNVNENNQNSGEKGLSFIVELDPKHHDDYLACISGNELLSLPIEYYHYYWRTFSRDNHITPKSIPIKSLLVDSSGPLSQQTSSRYISRIIKDKLDADTIVGVSQAHRKLKDSFKNDYSIKKANDLLKGKGVDSQIELAVELGTKNEWEESVTIEIGTFPFQFLGRGNQSQISLDVVLAKASDKLEVILIEEPENHQSHSNLNVLLDHLTKKLKDKQVLVTTHNSFVANKLGLQSLVLLENKRTIRLTDLTQETQDYFMRLAGYDSLRLLLCKKAILVEGPSDELIIQKAYMCDNGGSLPIHHGIEVISVGTADLRFLEISKLLNKPTVVVKDTDGDIKALEKKYKQYLSQPDAPSIKIIYDPELVEKEETSIKDYNWNTLEPEIIKVNDFKSLCNIFGKTFTTKDELRKYMLNNKTEYALKLFTTNQSFKFPEYVKRAVNQE